MAKDVCCCVFAVGYKRDVKGNHGNDVTGATVKMEPGETSAVKAADNKLPGVIVIQPVKKEEENITPKVIKAEPVNLQPQDTGKYRLLFQYASG